MKVPDCRKCVYFDYDGYDAYCRRWYRRRIRLEGNRKSPEWCEKRKNSATNRKTSDR